MKIQPREKGMQEYAHHKGNRLCTADAAGTAGRREALRRRDGGDGADPHAVRLSDPAKALHWVGSSENVKIIGFAKLSGCPRNQRQLSLKTLCRKYPAQKRN